MRQSGRQLAIALEQSLTAYGVPDHVVRVSHTAHDIKVAIVAGGKVHELCSSKTLGLNGIRALAKQTRDVYHEGKRK